MYSIDRIINVLWLFVFANSMVKIRIQMMVKIVAIQLAYESEI